MRVNPPHGEGTAGWICWIISLGCLEGHLSQQNTMKMEEIGFVWLFPALVYLYFCFHPLTKLDKPTLIIFLYWEDFKSQASSTSEGLSCLPYFVIYLIFFFLNKCLPCFFFVQEWGLADRGDIGPCFVVWCWSSPHSVMEKVSYSKCIWIRATYHNCCWSKKT